MFKTRVDLDIEKLKGKKDSSAKLAQQLLDQQVLKDSNYYIPKDKSNLEGSGIRSSLIGQGKIIWDTPYARRLYYNPKYNFSKDMNPNARGLWFEAAKRENKSDWLELVKKEFARQFTGGG